MKLLKFEIPKSKLLTIPEDERIFFVQMTHLAHELYILRKIMIFSFAKREDHEIIRRAQAGQALFIARITTGKLWEGWELIRTHFLSNKFSEGYLKNFSLMSQNDFRKLKRYFNNKNMMCQVRREFAFHYSKESSDKIKQQIEETSDSEIFSLYLSKYLGNCFYEMSDTLVNRSIFKLMPASDDQNAVDDFLKEIQTVVGYFIHFIEEYVSAFARKHLDDQYSEIEIPEPPKFDDVIIPFFASEPDRHPNAM